MFLAYNKSIPLVEDCILDKLGPRDLVHTKRVCRDWATSVRRYIGQMGANRTGGLLEQSFCLPVWTYATVKLPYPVRDLTVNNRGDVYILGDESITQLDPVTLLVKRCTGLDKRLAEKDSNENELFLYANKDGSQFVIRTTTKGSTRVLIGYGLKYDKSKSEDKLTREKTPTDDLCLMRRNDDVVGLPMRFSAKGVAECRGSGFNVFTSTCLCQLHKMKKRLGASDLIRLPNGTCIFAKEIKSCFFHPESLLVHRTRSGYVPIARLPMRGVRLRVVGTRVLCFSKMAKKGAESDSIIAFDVWNPDSLDICGDNVELTRKMH